jgi:hypothetical protein
MSAGTGTEPTLQEPQSKRFFYRMQPMVGPGITYAEVATGKAFVVIGDTAFNVEKALELRAWLNSVLPL